MTFGSNLRQLRIKKNMRQEDLARVIKVHRATVGKYETDERFPDKATLQKLADFFCVSVDFLLGRTTLANPYYIVENNLTIREREGITDSDKSNVLDLSGLPEEAVKQINEYVEFIRKKYGEQKYD